jgi:uroporphyrinogen decarboxylase
MAADMDPVRLKREFGKHLTFWGGGCDTQQILTHGTLEDIKEETKRMISIFAPGGGFVFTTVHNILREIEPEKVLAVYDTAYEHGWYR